MARKEYAWVIKEWNDVRYIHRQSTSPHRRYAVHMHINVAVICADNNYLREYIVHHADSSFFTL